MGTPTPYGVYYNLSDSPYTYEFLYYRYYFSSVKHLEKFKRDLSGRVDWLNDSLSRRFGISFQSDRLAAFQLYRQIEKRGFLVEYVPAGFLYTSPSQLMCVIDIGDYDGK